MGNAKYLGGSNDVEYGVDAKDYVLIVFSESGGFTSDSHDFAIETSESFIELSDEDIYEVGKSIVSAIGQLTGYSQAKDILQGLYGAI